MPASRGLLALLAGASMVVACGGVFVGHKAVSRAEAYMQDALTYRAQADDFKARLAVVRGQLADAERRIAACKSPSRAGRPGTVSYRANSWMNVKTPNGKPNYWKGQRGIDSQGHAVWEAPEYSLRAGALTLRSYYKRHGIKTVRGIVERYSTSNHAEYADYVATRMKVSPDEEINVIRRIPELLRYMSEFETGRPVPPRMLATLDILGKI